VGCIPLSLEEVHARHPFSATTSRGVARTAPRTQRVEPRSQRAMPVLGASCDGGEPHDLRVGELKRACLGEKHLGRGRTERTRWRAAGHRRGPALRGEWRRGGRRE
jgi:hypothetical protein